MALKCSLREIYTNILNSGKFPKEFNKDRLILLIKKP